MRKWPKAKSHLTDSEFASPPHPLPLPLLGLDQQLDVPEYGRQASASSTPLRDACLDYVRAWCEKSFSCDWRNTVESCVAGSGSTCPDLLFSEGTTRTVDQVLACATEFADLPCDQWMNDQLPDCIIPGTKAVGEPCVFGGQCASFSCGGWSDDACATCNPIVESEGSCGPDLGDCPDGEFCDGSSCVPLPVWTPPTGDPPAASTDPIAPVVVASLPLGSECTGGDCEEGTSCRLADPIDPYPVCAELPEVGEACGLATSGNRACSADSRCDPQDFICEPLASKGEPCTPQLPYLTKDACGADLDCGCTNAGCTEGSCMTYAREDDACDELTLCEGGTRCSGGICTPSDEQTYFPACLARAL